MDQELINSCTLNKKIKDVEHLRNSFNSLALQTFEISFEAWYQQGHWNDNYIPYAFVKDNEVIANVSINHLNFEVNGIKYQTIQIGTVMTAPNYRGNGLAAHLINRVLDEYKDQVDYIYLYANNTVLDFYPKFGFVENKSFSTSYHKTVEGSASLTKLNLDNHDDQERLFQYFKKTNPFSKISLINNFDLVMFHCGSYLKDCIYYCAKFDLIFIIEETPLYTLIYDIYGNCNQSLETVLDDINITPQKLLLGFTPLENNFEVTETHDDDVLFSYAQPIIKRRETLPLLSIA